MNGLLGDAVKLPSVSAARAVAQVAQHGGVEAVKEAAPGVGVGSQAGHQSHAQQDVHRTPIHGLKNRRENP